MRQEKVSTKMELVALSNVKVGDFCYTPRYGFKLQVIGQSEFETEIKIVTPVKEGYRTNFVRSNTELVCVNPPSIDDIIDTMEEEVAIPAIVDVTVAKKRDTSKAKRRGRPSAINYTEVPEGEFVRPKNLDRKGAIIDLVVDYLAEKPRDINEIVNFMYMNKTHATKQECAGFFRSSYATEEKRASIKKIEPRIYKVDGKYAAKK